MFETNEDENSKKENAFSYDEFRSRLPSDAKTSSVSVDSYISTNVAKSNFEMAKVVFETAANVQSYLKKSKKDYFTLVPHVNLRDYSFYASATPIHDKTTGVFTVNAGVFYAVTDICSTLIHRQEFMSDWLPDSREFTLCLCPRCLNIRSFDGWLVDYSWLASDNPDTAPIFNPMVGSSAPTPRSAIGGFLIKRCLYWISAHEIGHLLLDHLTFINERDTENAAKRSIDESRLFHIIEMEADFFATCLDVNIPEVVDDLKKRFDNVRDISDYAGEWPEPTEKIATRLLALVPFIIGVILFHQYKYSTYKYPSPQTRFSYLKQRFEVLLKRRNQSDWLTDKSILLQDYATIAATCVNNQEDLNLITEWFIKEPKEDFSEIVLEIQKFDNEYGTSGQRLKEYGLFEIYNEYL